MTRYLDICILYVVMFWNINSAGLKLQRCATMGLQENFGSEDPDKEDGKYLLGMGDLVNQLKRGRDTAAAIPMGVRRAEEALLLRMESILPNIFSHTTKAKVKYIQQNICHGCRELSLWTEMSKAPTAHRFQKSNSEFAKIFTTHKRMMILELHGLVVEHCINFCFENLNDQLTISPAVLS